MTDSQLTHADESGAARMVDVGDKPVTRREARAEGFVSMQAATLGLIRENAAAKGDVLAVARVAGISAAKRTWELIPLCHAIPLTGVQVDFTLDDDRCGVHVSATARTDARTGVEMEAMTAVSVAALTIYDMVKAVDREIAIGDVRLTFKSGGRSGTYSREE